MTKQATPIFPKKHIFTRESSINHDLRNLSLSTRNKLRAILSLETKKSIPLVERLREYKGAPEVAKIEKVLRNNYIGNSELIPLLFPVEYQTRENYHRLELIEIEKQLEIIDICILDNRKKINETFEIIKEVNDSVFNKDFKNADKKIRIIWNISGYSHFLLRKCCLIDSLCKVESDKGFTSGMIKSASIGTNNLIVNCLIQCYQEKQDFFALKKSVLNIPDKGKRNQFTRDLTRIAFSPYSVNIQDFRTQLQSNYQSSLIDSIIFLKTNKNLITNLEKYSNINSIFKKIEQTSLNIDSVANIYTNLEDPDYEVEYLFYKHSSAWFENESFLNYRIFLDNFYDDPLSKYINLDDHNLNIIKKWVSIEKLQSLSKIDITSHQHLNLKKLEESGTVTRTATFNYLVHSCQGNDYLDNDNLYKLMGSTRDLDNNININYIKTLAKHSSEEESKIIYYLLIAKKSKNENDGHYLRRTIQKVIIDKYDKDIVKFISYISSKSKDVAEYMYEVFTEDFLSRLSLVIVETAQITETRAALHKWMGESTKNKNYLDRARTLLIDHQINRVRNEIDDHRIYVDAARFIEWLKDEVVHDLNSVLTNITHSEVSDYTDDPQLLHIIEKSYAAFCSNNIFGISSYLGRRIRHGTFKGHLYSNVINIEKDHQSALKDQYVNGKWLQWKKSYELFIDIIIKEHLHIESSSKRYGLLKPNLNNINKADIAFACAQTLAKEFIVSKNTQNSVIFLLEYCWRMTEIDLKNINNFLKSKKAELLNAELLDEIKNCPNVKNRHLSKDFVRDLQKNINDKLTSMYGWFKRPLSVSPKASLSLLYKAVVAEVKESFPQFDADTSFNEENDIELVGGPYHVLYDAFYVVIYNAAKHGKPSGVISRKFNIINRNVIVTISSEIKDDATEEFINGQLKITSESDIINAQQSEERSGIRKLHHLAYNDKNFSIHEINCKNRAVTVSVAYSLEH